MGGIQDLTIFLTKWPRKRKLSPITGSRTLLGGIRWLGLCRGTRYSEALLGSPNKQIVTPKVFSDGSLEMLGKQASFDLRVRVPHNRWWHYSYYKIYLLELDRPAVHSIIYLQTCPIFGQSPQLTNRTRLKTQDVRLKGNPVRRSSHSNMNLKESVSTVWSNGNLVGWFFGWGRFFPKYKTIW